MTEPPAPTVIAPFSALVSWMYAWVSVLTLLLERTPVALSAVAPKKAVTAVVASLPTSALILAEVSAVTVRSPAASIVESVMNARARAGFSAPNS